MHNTPAGSPPAGKMPRVTFLVLVITTSCYVLSLLPAAAAMLMSVMAFDSGSTWQAWTAVGFIWSYPIAVLVASAASWKLYGKQRYKLALWWLVLPLLPYLVAGLYLWRSSL